MLKAFTTSFISLKKRLYDTNKLKLGRWQTNTCEKTKDIKQVYANIDNCGDLICGQPLKNKDYIKVKS